MYTEQDLEEMFRHGYISAAEEVESLQEMIRIMNSAGEGKYRESLALAIAMVKINHY